MHFGRLKLIQLTLALCLVGFNSANATASVGRSWAIDGVYGPHTRHAVMRFQRAHHLVVDGVAGPATLKALNRPHRHTLTVGSSVVEVRLLQQALAARGYWRDGRAHAAARVAIGRSARQR